MFYTGAMSTAKNATILPLFLTALIGIAVISAIIGAAAILIAKHGQQSIELDEPSPW
jgi:hypothetical protein